VDVFIEDNRIAAIGPHLPAVRAASRSRHHLSNFVLPPARALSGFATHFERQIPAGHRKHSHRFRFGDSGRR